MEQQKSIFANAQSQKIVEPCASCGVRCCNRFAVPLTGFDVVHIMMHTKKETPQECKQFCELADAKNIESAPHSLVFIFNQGVLEERLLTLVRKKNMYCVFSKHSKGCEIWGAHPTVCRAYPFSLDDQSQIKYVKNFVCPRKWSEQEYDKDAVREIIERQNSEIEQYNKIIREWNARHSKEKSEMDFFDFLIAKTKIAMKKKRKFEEIELC